jgi:hypothetical protein
MAGSVTVSSIQDEDVNQAQNKSGQIYMLTPEHITLVVLLLPSWRHQAMSLHLPRVANIFILAPSKCLEMHSCLQGSKLCFVSKLVE